MDFEIYYKGVIMNKIFDIALLLFAFALTVMYVHLSEDYRELETQNKLDRAMQTVEYEKIRKEIRLLKTDLYILQNGYEEEN